MVFDILEKKLTDAGLVEPGVSLFRNIMPAHCLIGVLIRTPLTGVPIDPHIVGWSKSRIQVIVRHVDPVLGVELSRDVIKTLVVQGLEKHPATAEHAETHINVFYPEADPIQFPLLEGNGIEWSINFRMVYGQKPAWM